MSSCTLCEVADQQSLLQTVLDHREDGQVDWLEAKRELVEEHCQEGEVLTLAGLKRHISDHIQVVDA